MEEGFLYALAFFAVGVVLKQFAFFVGHDQFVVDHFHVIFFQAPAVAVLQDFQVVFDGDHFVERRDEKVPRAHRGVADFKAVYDFIGFFSVFNFVAEFFEVVAVPLFGFVEFLDNGLADGLAAHVHGDEARGEEGTVFVAVYFFKNQAEHRSVDQRFVIFLDFFPAFCAKVVGVQERKQVLERAQVAGPFFALLVFQHGL